MGMENPMFKLNMLLLLLLSKAEDYGEMGEEDFDNENDARIEQIVHAKTTFAGR